MQAIVASIDERRHQQLEADPHGVVKEISARRREGADWILSLGQDAPSLERLLRIHAGERAAAAVFGRGLGEVIIADSFDDPDGKNAVDRGGYGPVRFVRPEAVAAIASALRALPEGPVPCPDPDGYAPDPRAETDAKIGEVSRMLALHGPDPESPEQMADLARRLEALVAHYARAASDGHGALVYVT